MLVGTYSGIEVSVSRGEKVRQSRWREKIRRILQNILQRIVRASCKTKGMQHSAIRYFMITSITLIDRNMNMSK